jgi:metallo-beta-lactamase family protein
MCEAGRIRHHLRHRLWNPKTTVLFVGYQAEGTLGRLLLEGKTNVTIFGHHIKVTARIRQIETYSGHADRAELKDWLLDRRPITKGIFLVHGEEVEASALRSDLAASGFDEETIYIPAIDDEIEFIAGKPPRAPKPVKPRIQPHELIGLDWHNDLAQFQIDLREAFDKAADKRSRNILLRRLRRALEG